MTVDIVHRHKTARGRATLDNSRAVEQLWAMGRSIGRFVMLVRGGFLIRRVLAGCSADREMRVVERGGDWVAVRVEPDSLQFS
jgi:hypothetical protein